MPPRMQSEEILNKGIALEEAGKLTEACKMYERVLVSEPGNLELRCVSFEKGSHQLWDLPFGIMFGHWQCSVSYTVTSAGNMSQD